MGLSHMEFYQALVPSLGEEVARILADNLTLTGDLATKADLKAVEVRFERALGELRSDLTAELGRGLVTNIRWMVSLIAGLWATTVGGFIALLVNL